MIQIISLILAAFLVSPLALAQEGGDVCNIRPDLCDEGGGTPEPEVEQTIRRVPRAKRVKSVTQPQRKLKPRKQSRRTSANCRVAGAPYNLNSVDLPICKANPTATAKPSAAKKSGRRPASSMNINSYMNSNANHPAFARRLGERQRAFQDPVRTVAPATQETATPGGETASAAPAPAAAPVAGY